MADQLTSGDNASATPDQGQPQTSDGATPQNTTPEKIDLFKLPEFKGYQQQMNRTVTALQQQLARLEQERQQAAMSGMDDLEKTRFLLQQREAEIANYREALEAKQVQEQKWADVQELAELTGAPASELVQAGTYDEAVKLSIKWMKDHGASAKEIKEAKREANSVDLGGGGASTPQDRESRERNELLKSGDTKSLFLKILEG